MEASAHDAEQCASAVKIRKSPHGLRGQVCEALPHLIDCLRLNRLIKKDSRIVIRKALEIPDFAHGISRWIHKKTVI